MYCINMDFTKSKTFADEKINVELLPTDKIVDPSKLKVHVSADDKIKVLKMMIFAFDRVENIKG